jgi:DNA-directed RNA polymerase specialized sigma subunit
MSEKVLRTLYYKEKSMNIDEKLKDQDLMRIARSAANSFTSVLSQDEIENCILTALWKATNKYDENSNTKFSTFLYNGVKMECLTQRKFNLSHSNKNSRSKNAKKQYPLRFTTKTKQSSSRRNDGLHKNNIEDPHNYVETVDMIDEIKNLPDPDLVFDRFYKNMTIKELANKREVCGETIRIRLKKNLKSLEKNLSESV